ncbi:MAG: hypothetical protein Q9196_007432, partial [Gyalolechia fulgens]
MTAFQDWMHSWITTADASDPATNIAQLKLELQGHDGWVTAWLDSTLSPSPAAAPPPLPSPVPVTTSANVNQANSPSSDLRRRGSASGLVRGGEFFQSPAKSPVATTLVPVISASSTPSVAAGDPLISPNLAVPRAISQPVAPANPPWTGGYVFNAQSSDNVAVYYGQSPATSQTSLAQTCQDENVDIVILAFLTTFFGFGGYPNINLGAACGGPSSAMQAVGASGLLSCPTIENDIKTCQALGKKVLLSLGGAESTTAFSSDSQASDFATRLWNLFGGGKGESTDMRPFGGAVIDGFDVDNEDHSTAFYTTFVSSLRTAMNTDPSKQYYISAAPQCPRPDASIPLSAMQTMDFVFVQFYNNGDCNVGQPGFEASLRAWSQDLSAN